MKSPFKFLDSYSKEDKDIFFGRQADVDEIYEKIFRGRLLLVYGASGTGKTSILNCGLANKFEDTDWFPVNIRRKNNIVESIRNEIEKFTVTEIPVDKSLPDAVYSLYLDFFKPIYLIFDQFEELFISGDKDEQNAFVSFLIALLQKGYNTRVIITIREEYLAYFASFEEQLPNFFDNRYRVETITRLKAEEVIINTCKKTGIELINEKEVARNIIANILTVNGKVELTYLQVYLDKLYNQYYKNETLPPVIFSVKLVNEVGDINDVLSLFLEEQIAKTEDPVFAWQMLKAFITENGTKKTTTVESVKKYFNDNQLPADERKISDYSKLFLQLKIIRPLDENKTFEITHDSLANKVWEKVSAHDRNIVEVKSFITNAYKINTSRKIYLRAEDLAYIKPYEEKVKLEIGEAGFINKSRKRIFARKLIAAAIIVSIITTLSLLTIYSFKKQNEAEKAKSILEKNNTELLNLTRKADSISRVAKAKTLEAQASADSAKYQSDNASKANLMALRNLLEAKKSRDTAKFEKNKTQQLLNQTDQVLKILNMLQSDPTQAQDSALKIYSGIAEERLQFVLRQTVYGAFSGILYENKKSMGMPIKTFAINNDNTFAIVAGSLNEVLYYDIKKGAISSLSGEHPFPVTSIAIDKNSNAFVTIDQQNNLIFWDNNRQKFKSVKLKFEVAAVRALKKADGLVIAYKNGDTDMYDFAGNFTRSITSPPGLLSIENLKIVDAKSCDFLTVSGNNIINAWDIKNASAGYKLTGFKISVLEKINDVDISGDGAFIAIATTKKIAVYKLISNASKLSVGENLLSLNSVAPVQKIAFLRSNEIIFGAADGDLVYYNIQTGQKKNVQNATGNNFISEIYKVNNPSIFVTGGEDGSLKLWNTSITEPLVFDFTYKDEKKPVSSKCGVYRFAIDASQSVATLTEDNGHIESKFFLDKIETDKNMYSLSWGKVVSSNIVLLDKGKEVQSYPSVIPQSQCIHNAEAAYVPGSFSNASNTLMIKKKVLAANGKYVLIELISEDQENIYYVIFPTFLSMKSFIENKKM
jgi:WD40 repeat protein